MRTEPFQKSLLADHGNASVSWCLSTAVCLWHDCGVKKDILHCKKADILRGHTTKVLKCQICSLVPHLELTANAD